MGTVPRPKRELRFYVEGRPVSGPEFWQALRAAGGTATVTALDPQPAAYRLTEKGRRALSRGQEAGR